MRTNSFSKTQRKPQKSTEKQQEKEKIPKPDGFRNKKRAAGRIRTADLILTKDALYLLSYSSKFYAP